MLWFKDDRDRISEFLNDGAGQYFNDTLNCSDNMYLITTD